MKRDDFPLLTVLRGGRLFDPVDRGPMDILICGGTIGAVAPSMDAPAGVKVQVEDLDGFILIPGLVDIHTHPTGGGGEGGPSTRVPEPRLSSFTTAGVTTAVGMLGTDDVTRHPESLLARVLGLCAEGITARMLTGSYRLPPVTVTGSVRKDIALIPPIIGVGEVALSDHRSSQPDFRDFAGVAAEARVGGLLGGKPGILHVHMGGGASGMDYLFRLARETEIPVTQVLPTHVTRSAGLFEQALELAAMGGNVDITASGTRRAGGVDLSAAVSAFLSSEIPLERVTVSSDAGGSLPVFDDKGVLKGITAAGPGSLLTEFRRLVKEEGFPVTDVLGLFTRNPAMRSGLAGRKGCLAPGADADILVLDRDWELQRVYAGGRLMVEEGRPLVTGTFE